MENFQQIEVQAKCIDCGENITIRMDKVAHETDILREALLNAAQCANCIAVENAADNQWESKQRVAEQEYLNKSTYAARRKASQLDFYRLAYEPQDPRANQKLFDWVGQRTDKCILLTGETGQCKSRIMQYYADQLLLEGKSVYYSPTADLLNKITDAFFHKKQGRQFLRELKEYDVLILDDFCKYIESQAKIMYLWQVFERRHVRFDQEQNLSSGKWNPLYWTEHDRKDGWQIWLATNCDANTMGEKFDRFKNEAGDPIIRRIVEMCEIWPEKKGE